MVADYWYDEHGNAHRNIVEKLILLNGPSPEMKSFEDIHSQFQGLIRKKAMRWYRVYEFDEMCQVAAIALWKAYERYDYYARPIPFVAIASTFIKYDHLNYHVKHKPKYDKKSSQVRSIHSLHALVSSSDGETELQDLIGEDETFTQETADRMLLEKVLLRIPDKQKQDIFAYIDGYKMKELAEAKDVSSQQQAIRLRSAFLRFRALYIKELVR